MTSPILEIDNVVKEFRVGAGLFGRAGSVVSGVAGVSLTADKGETLGIVGESGCGKSTLGRVVLNLLKPTSGEVRIDGVSTTAMKNADLRRRAQMVFQDPYASLNPRKFQRVHRSTIVNLDLVEQVKPHTNGECFLVLESGAQIKVSRSYRDVVARFVH